MNLDLWKLSGPSLRTLWAGLKNKARSLAAMGSGRLVGRVMRVSRESSVKMTRVTRQSCSDGLHFGLHDGPRRRAVLLFLFLDTIPKFGLHLPGKQIYVRMSYREILINNKGQMYSVTHRTSLSPTEHIR